jgi:hypothetical protein
VVDVAALSDADDDHHHSVVLERADYAIIADATFPEVAQGSLQALADFSGVIDCSYPPV